MPEWIDYAFFFVVGLVCGSWVNSWIDAKLLLYMTTTVEAAERRHDADQKLIASHKEAEAEKTESPAPRALGALLVVANDCSATLATDQQKANVASALADAGMFIVDTLKTKMGISAIQATGLCLRAWILRQGTIKMTPADYANVQATLLEQAKAAETSRLVVSKPKAAAKPNPEVN